MSISANINPRSEEIRQRARHVIFVEGSDDNSIDKIIIDALFRNNEIDINVKPLGASFHIRSVAEALHPHHPEYYFIIDRDHCSEQEIENTWANFPDQAKKNLLIWRKREIENYFLSIDYLMQSSYIDCGAEQIQNHLLDIARQRVFLEAANYVIVGCREKFKSNWIQIFDRVSEFTTRNDALQQLISMSEFSQYQQDFAQHTDSSNLERELDQILRSFRGESEDLVIGCGNWINLMRGKELLPTLISRCFRVK